MSPLRRRYASAVGENDLGERLQREPELIGQHALQHAAQIGCGVEIAALVEALGLEARPVGDHPAAGERAAGKSATVRRAMIGAVGAVDANGAAEFGDRDDDRVPPGVAEVGLERVEGGVEPLKALGEQALRRALVLMGVETVEGQRRDPRPVGRGKQARRALRRNAHLLDRAAAARLPRRLGAELPAATLSAASAALSCSASAGSRCA